MVSPMLEARQFVDDLIFGRKGEDRVFNYLRHHKQTKAIMDVTKDKKYQEDDIDFLVQTIEDKIYHIEVKNDKQTDKTGNIVYETMSHTNKGCLARSKADLIYYVTEHAMYCFSLTNIRLFISHTNPKEVLMGDGAKGYLLSVRSMLDGGYIQIVEENQWT